MSLTKVINLSEGYDIHKTVAALHATLVTEANSVMIDDSGMVEL